MRISNRKTYLLKHFLKEILEGYEHCIKIGLIYVNEKQTFDGDLIISSDDMVEIRFEKYDKPQT